MSKSESTDRGPSGPQVPVFARCKLRKDLWFYVAWRNEEHMDPSFTGTDYADPPAFGFTFTLSEADDAARGSWSGSPRAVSPRVARTYHQRWFASDQVRRVAPNGLEQAEVVYTVGFDDNGVGYLEEHEVSRRTETRTFVHVESRSAWWRYRARVVGVDRKTLEREGYVDWKLVGRVFATRDGARFFAERWTNVWAFVALGLGDGCTVNDVDSAYLQRVGGISPDAQDAEERFEELLTYYRIAKDVLQGKAS